MTPEVGALVSPRARWTAIRRPLAAALAVALVAVGALGLAASSATAAPDVPGAAQASADGADFLVSSLVNDATSLTAPPVGDHLITVYGGASYPDQGLTADAVFALLAAGGHGTEVTAMTAWLESQAGAYTVAADNFTNPDPVFGGGPYSGAVAKLALVAMLTGNDPTSFGGLNLLDLLTSHPCTGPAATPNGTCTAAGDFYSAFSSISQALAVLALQASPDPADHLTADSPQVARLHSLQCTDGGFTSELLAPGDVCESDVDATGYVVQALAVTPGTELWLGAAQQYLESAQLPTGLFNGTAGANANSTALAAQAFQTLTPGASGIQALLAEPTTPPSGPWESSLTGLLTLQAPDSGFGVSDPSAADVRASTQAVLAMSLGTLPSLLGTAIVSLPQVALPDPTPAPTESAPAASPAAADPTPVAGTTGAAATPAAASTDAALAATGADSSIGIWGVGLVGLGLILLLVSGRAVPLTIRRRRRP